MNDKKWTVGGMWAKLETWQNREKCDYLQILRRNIESENILTINIFWPFNPKYCILKIWLFDDLPYKLYLDKLPLKNIFWKF